MNTIASFLCWLPQALLVTLLAGVLPDAAAADIYVIAHSDTKLTADSLRDIYIGEKQFSGAVKITPLDNAAAQADFLSKALKLDPSRYANLWVKKSFRDALNPPVVKSSDKEIIDIVRKTPGAIGYVSSVPPVDIVLLQKY